jgi:hypothetical protein
VGIHVKKAATPKVEKLLTFPQFHKVLSLRVRVVDRKRGNSDGDDNPHCHTLKGWLGQTKEEG